MEDDNVRPPPKWLTELQCKFRTVMEKMQSNPKTAELLNTTVGLYLTEHPFFALTVLVFGAMAAVPVGLFLTFFLVTSVVAFVGFVFLEAVLFTLGAVALLGVLGGLALLSLPLSCALMALYVMTSHLLTYHHSQRLPENINDTEKTESERSKSL